MQSEWSAEALGGPCAYFTIFKAICKAISENYDEEHCPQITDEHISALYQLLGKSLLKSLDLIDKQAVECITVESKRSYFVCHLPPSDYHLLPTMKAFLGRERFTTDEELRAEVNSYLLEVDSPSHEEGLKNSSPALPSAQKKLVKGSTSTYSLYSTVPFCDCPHFRFNVLKKKANLMCKHIVACHLAFAAGKCSTYTSPDYAPAVGN